MADTEQTFPPRINRGAKCNKEKKVSQCHFSVFFRSLGQVFQRGRQVPILRSKYKKKEKNRERLLPVLSGEKYKNGYPSWDSRFCCDRLEYLLFYKFSSVLYVYVSRLRFVDRTT